jgi:hypothetical protein
VAQRVGADARLRGELGRSVTGPGRWHDREGKPSNRFEGQEFFQDSAGPPDPSNSGRRTLRETPAAENYNPFAAIEMTLSAGSRLGPYEILAPIGAGGMGEV